MAFISLQSTIAQCGSLAAVVSETSSLLHSSSKPMFSTVLGCPTVSLEMDSRTSASRPNPSGRNGSHVRHVAKAEAVTGPRPVVLEKLCSGKKEVKDERNGEEQKELIFDMVMATPLAREKTVVLVRHGLSSWNAEGRVQGSSDASVLTQHGQLQAVKCREALQGISFDCCFASPISRAKESAEIVWEGREEPIVFLDSLREANLLFLEGMLNADAKREYPELFRAWREDPANFNVDGAYPVRSLWAQSLSAWQSILSSPGEMILVVTHKSLLRALLCTALGLGPERFRSIDVDNGGINVFKVDKKGELMLKGLNLVSHLSDGVRYTF